MFENTAFRKIVVLSVLVVLLLGLAGAALGPLLYPINPGKAALQTTAQRAQAIEAGAAASERAALKRAVDEAGRQIKPTRECLAILGKAQAELAADAQPRELSKKLGRLKQEADQAGCF